MLTSIRDALGLSHTLFRAARAERRAKIKAREDWLFARG